MNDIFRTATRRLGSPARAPLAPEVRLRLEGVALRDEGLELADARLEGASRAPCPVAAPGESRVPNNFAPHALLVAVCGNSNGSIDASKCQ